jgi:pimeloyl-ACP methyl ester carboxylesterase
LDSKLFAIDTGKGQAVLLIHGQPGYHMHWIKVIDLLKDDFRVIAVDRPGYGRSTQEAEGFLGNAARLVTFLKERQINDAIVVGHSWGGGVGLAMAEFYPDYVKGLVLVSSIGVSTSINIVDRLSKNSFIGMLGGIMTVFAADLIPKGVSGLIKNKVVANMFPEITARVGFSHPIVPKPVLKSIKSFADEQAFLLEELPKVEANLKRIKCPTIVMAGTKDYIVLPKAAEALAGAIPEAKFYLVKGAGHMIPIEAPREIAEKIYEII